MAIKVNGNTVITDQEKGQFKTANPGAYTTAQRDSTLSPSTGDMIFNTDEGKLQVFNGQSWIDGGGQPVDETIPQINTVTLSETAGEARFTDKDFDINIDMVTQGVPVSDKAVKGKLTVVQTNYASTDPVTSNTGSSSENSSSTDYKETYLNSLTKDTYGPGRWLIIKNPGDPNYKLRAYLNYSSSYWYEYDVPTDDSTQSLSQNNWNQRRSLYTNTSSMKMLEVVYDNEGYSRWITCMYNGYNYYGGCVDSQGVDSSFAYGPGNAFYDKHGQLWGDFAYYNYSGNYHFGTNRFENALVRYPKSKADTMTTNYDWERDGYPESKNFTNGYYSCSTYIEPRDQVIQVGHYNNKIGWRYHDALGDLDGANYGTNYPDTWTHTSPMGYTIYPTKVIYLKGLNKTFVFGGNGGNSSWYCGVIDNSTNTWYAHDSINAQSSQYIACPRVLNYPDSEHPDRIWIAKRSSTAAWNGYTYWVYSDDAGYTWTNYKYWSASYETEYFWGDGAILHGSFYSYYMNTSDGNGSSYYLKATSSDIHQNKLTLATGKNISSFTEGTPLYLLGKPRGAWYSGVVSYNNGTNQIYVNSNYYYKPGDILSSTLSQGQQETTAYLVIDSNGNVTNTNPVEQDYVLLGPGNQQKIHFNPVLENDLTPDEAFPTGTDLQVTIRAKNTAAESVKLSNKVVPIGLNPIKLQLAGRNMNSFTNWISDGGGNLDGTPDANANAAWRDQQYYVTKSAATYNIGFTGEATVGQERNFSLTFDAADLTNKVVVIGSQLYKSQYDSALIKIEASSTTPNVSIYSDGTNQNGIINYAVQTAHKFLIGAAMDTFTIDFKVTTTADEGQSTSAGSYQVLYYRLEDTSGNELSYT